MSWRAHQRKRALTAQREIDATHCGTCCASRVPLYFRIKGSIKIKIRRSTKPLQMLLAVYPQNSFIIREIRLQPLPVLVLVHEKRPRIRNPCLPFGMPLSSISSRRLVEEDCHHNRTLPLTLSTVKRPPNAKRQTSNALPFPN